MTNCTRLLYVFFALLLSQTDVNAQFCLFDGRAVPFEEEALSTLFSGSTSIDFNGIQLYIDNEEKIITGWSSQAFESKEELEELLNCRFHISQNFNADISGTIVSFTMDESQNSDGVFKLDYISFIDYHRKYDFILVNKEYYFEFVNAQKYVSKLSKYFTLSEEPSYNLEYVLPDQIEGSFTQLTDAEFEMVSEWGIKKMGYDSIVEHSAEFITSYTHFNHEVSDCPNAVFEIEYINVLAKDEHSKINVVPAQFEEVYESILLAHEYIGPHSYKRQAHDYGTVNTSTIKNLEVNSVKDDCFNPNFIWCLEYNVILDSFSQATEIGLAYPPCAEDYQSAGEYCFNFDITVPAQYTTRSLTRLNEPSYTDVQSIDAEYQTVEVQKIANKDELEDSCIQYKLDSVAYQKLSIPALSENIYIEATYTLYESQLLKTPATFEVETSNEEAETIEILTGVEIQEVQDYLFIPEFTPDCMHESIKIRLQELNYLEIGASSKSKRYYEAVIQYQLDEMLNVGAIDRLFLDFLNVEYR